MATTTRPADRCAACQGHRLPAPHDWATDGDLMTSDHTEPYPGGLGPCGDLHQFVSAAEFDRRIEAVRRRREAAYAEWRKNWRSKIEIVRY